MVMRSIARLREPDVGFLGGAAIAVCENFDAEPTETNVTWPVYAVLRCPCESETCPPMK